MLNTFSTYQIYEKTLLTGSHLGFLKWEKFRITLFMFKYKHQEIRSYVYDSKPDCVLQQLINIIYAN